MKKILYYVTDHGLGHLTRSISIIREFDENVEFIIRNSNEKFIKKSLNTTRVFSGQTDQGPILLNDNISIDWDKTRETMKEWYNDFNQRVAKERDFIEKIKPDLVISDITPIPLSPSKELEIPTLAISNFTWSDFLNNLPEIEANVVNNSYELTSLAIQLPLCTTMEIFPNKRKVGFVAKYPTENREDIRKKLGVSDSDFMIFINLPNFYHVSIQTQNNCKVFSTGARTNNENVTFIEPWVEGQNLNLAADLVLCKCGYGMLSECLTSGTPFKFLIDKNHPEQNAMYENLKLLKHDNMITANDMGEIKLQINEKILRYKPLERSNLVVKDMIMEFLK